MFTAAAGHAAPGQPSVHTDRGCYLVGQRVLVTGSGFAPGRTFDVAVDGVDLGRSTTTGIGEFTVSLRPGGLPSGWAQHVDRVDATDGVAAAQTRFTLTRPAGFIFLTSGGNPNSLRAPLELWGFSLTGARRQVYLHYVSPAGQPRSTVALGRTSGQCGSLLTPKRRVFPFVPTPGRWTLQVDTRPAYLKSPGRPVARIHIQIR
jgi:hypothetical protein